MENTVKERLKKFLKENNISGADFCRSIGVSSGFISGMRESIQPDKLKSIAINYPSLDIGWLMTGEGDMLKKRELADGEYPQTQLEISKRRIPFYDDVASVGGVNHFVANDNPQKVPSEWIDAGDWFPEATAAIRHYGDSMIEYPAGSILALKRVEDHRLIIWGRNYSIETTEFRITKRLQDGGDDYIMAYSSNMSTYPDGTLIHSPIKIPKETIRHIDLVLGCVTKEYSNGPVKIIK